MLFSNKIKKIALTLLFSVSITNLSADTNLPEIKTSEVAAPSSAPSNDLVIHVRTVAEQLEMVMSMIFDTQSYKGMALVNAVTPVLNACVPLKDLPEKATPEQLSQALSVLNQSSIFLAQIMDQEADKLGEFNPTVSNQTGISQAELEKEDSALANSFNLLIKKVEETYHDSWANMLLQVKTQLNKLDSILQTIFKSLDKSSLINKDDVKNDIKDLRSMLAQIRKELASSQANPQVVLGIFQINKAIIRYLQEANQYKFRKWAMVDLAGEFVRSQEEELPQMLDEIFAQIMVTNQALEKLEKDAEKIDLTVVNKTARLVGDYIIDPVHKYDLITWSLFGGASLGLLAYTAYYFDQTFFTKPDSWFRKLVGFPKHNVNGNGQIPTEDFVVQIIEASGLTPEKLKAALDAAKAQPITTEKAQQAVEICEILLNQAKSKSVNPLIPLNKADEFFTNFKVGTAAIGVGLLGVAAMSYNKLMKKHSDYWTRKIYVWFNKLKGGSFLKTADKYDEILGSSITFDDIIGMEYEKELVYPHLKYIKDPERWDADELTPPTGILLTGPTRTGKTFFAKAICGELHKQNPDKTIKFISIDAHDIKAEGIGMLMMYAKIMAPCVLFIDEIDLLGLQRSKDAPLLADFLQALSGIADKDPKKQVIVIGTTNKPENIDMSMLQSGRLALEIRFKYPNLKERKDFMMKRFEKLAIDPTIFDIDIVKLARETHNKSFEDIKLMLDTAFIHIGIKGQVISQEILEWALDQQLRKEVDVDSKEISKDEQRLLAAHYAGQVLTHILLDLDEKIAKVTTHQVVVKVKEESVYDPFYNPDHKKQTGLEQGAIFTYHEHDTLDIMTQSHNELSKRAKTLLAGRIAERMLTNTSSGFFGWKKNSSFNIIKTIVSDGIDLKSLSKAGQNAVNDDALAKLKAFEQEIEQLLVQNKEKLVALTDALQAQRKLTINQIMAIIEPAATQPAAQSAAPMVPAAA